MRPLRTLFSMMCIVLAAAVAAPGRADVPSLQETTPRNVLRAQAHVKRGRQEIERADKAKHAVPRIRRLDRALVFLRRARALNEVGDHASRGAIETEARSLLVTALTKQAQVHLDRLALPLARKRVKEALRLDPANEAARALRAPIEAAAKKDESPGEMVNLAGAEIDEKARRRLAGVPLTGRAVGRRR